MTPTKTTPPPTKAAWRASLGAIPTPEGVLFRVWAPKAASVAVVLESAPARPIPLEKMPDGYFRGVVEEARVGSLYRYRIDGQGPYPDPVSRYQPQGVHGPSQVVDPQAFRWSDAPWRGISSIEPIFYELHVGTFTAKGTFEGVMDRLPYLAELGVTIIELMPVNDFPGKHNWGYDGVSLFAPANAYGQPDDLRRLVNAAHQSGLAVMLDVVYNHLGPDGNYLGTYSPFYFTSHHKTPWGSAVNLDDEHAAEARGFFIENAMHWIHDYHIDGLRLDATHAMKDDSQRHFLAELSDKLRNSVSNHPILLVAEDCRNLAHIVKPEKEGGWGMDAVWADDFHHELRRSLAGDHEGYYQDFRGSIDDLITTIRKGWFYTGQHAKHFGGPRGTDPAGIPWERFVFFIQNHDQIGNRAFGERLNQQIEPAQFRMATALLLTVPEAPMLFMGQEWAANSPFLFFTDHNAKLGALVTEGRREEFKHFSVFTNPEAREKIPDPQNPETFDRSRLNWDELEEGEHASMHRLTRALLLWRRRELLPAELKPEDFFIRRLEGDAFELQYRKNGAENFRIIFQWKGFSSQQISVVDPSVWEIALTTEDPLLCEDPQRISMRPTQNALDIEFQRPGAVILRARPL